MTFDIPDIRHAIQQMVRVLKPGGALLIANVNGFISACLDSGWVRSGDGAYLHYPPDNYPEERAAIFSWRDISIENWHRPLSVYMSPLREQRL